VCAKFFIDQGNLEQSNSHTPRALTVLEKLNSNFVEVDHLFKLVFNFVFVCFGFLLANYEVVMCLDPLHVAHKNLVPIDEGHEVLGDHLHSFL
jgi:hypothetical protein